jgi:deoxyribonuclease-4
MFIGAHIPRQTTIIKTMEEIKKNGGNALQLFTTNPRSLNITDNSKYIKESHLIKKYCKTNNFVIMVHSPYVFNIAKPFLSGKKQLDIKDTIVYNDIITANYIGAIGYVIHVGKSTTASIKDALLIMRNNIKNIIQEMINSKIKTKLLLETPAGQGTELLKDFNDFIDFYYSFTDTEREYFKICIDTCHVWNAGYELHEIISLVPDKNDIVCVHINNSKNEKGAKVDRHEFIFEGKINPNDLKCFVDVFNKSIIIIETPSPNYDKEITFLSNN